MDSKTSRLFLPLGLIWAFAIAVPTVKATDGDIAMNIWRADLPKDARLERDTQYARGEQSVEEGEEVEAKQAISALQQMVEELKTLPVGKSREFYQQALKERGYTIIDIRNDQNQTEFAVEKNDQNLRLVVQFFDEELNESSKVNASGARLAPEE